jgi:hypothetical protein
MDIFIGGVLNPNADIERGKYSKGLIAHSDDTHRPHRVTLAPRTDWASQTLGGVEMKKPQGIALPQQEAPILPMVLASDWFSALVIEGECWFGPR